MRRRSADSCSERAQSAGSGQAPYAANERSGAAGRRLERAQSCGRSAGSASLRRSPRSGDCHALLDPWSHCGTRYVRCAHCAQTAAMSQRTKRVLRTRRPRACAARRRRGAAPTDHPHLCANHRSGPGRGAPVVLRKVVGGWLAVRLLRRRGADGLGVGAVRRDDFDLSEALYSGPSCRSRPESGAPQGSRRAAPTAAAKRCQPPAHGFATLDRWCEGMPGARRRLCGAQSLR